MLGTVPTVFFFVYQIRCWKIFENKYKENDDIYEFIMHVIKIKCIVILIKVSNINHNGIYLDCQLNTLDKMQIQKN